MDHLGTRPSLWKRIERSQSSTWSSIDPSYLAPPRKASYTERYRGTEYETPAALYVPEPPMSRGRTFVLASAVAIATVVAISLATVIPS